MPLATKFQRDALVTGVGSYSRDGVVNACPTGHADDDAPVVVQSLIINVILTRHDQPQIAAIPRVIVRAPPDNAPHREAGVFHALEPEELLGALGCSHQQVIDRFAFRRVVRPRGRPVIAAALKFSRPARRGGGNLCHVVSRRFAVVRGRDTLADGRPIRRAVGHDDDVPVRLLLNER